MQVIKKTIFWTAIIFIGLTILTLTVGQILPYEFADYKLQHKFYDIIIQGLPFAVLLTLLGTLKKENSKTKNWTFGTLTVLTSILCLVGQLFMIFTFGFGAWTTVTTIYKHKTDNREIKEQLYDIGAFGYGGQRTVEIKPFLTYWVLPTKIDTATIDKNEWNFVNEQGDIKFP
jgi:branched-subunit amino acid transport protein AzlD